MTRLPGTNAEDAARAKRLRSAQLTRTRGNQQRIAEVVAAQAAGWSKNRIARAMGVEASIVRAILTAAAKPHPKEQS